MPPDYNSLCPILIPLSPKFDNYFWLGANNIKMFAKFCIGADLRRTPEFGQGFISPRGPSGTYGRRFFERHAQPERPRSVINSDTVFSPENVKRVDAVVIQGLCKIDD
jgi:hypothetical protein